MKIVFKNKTHQLLKNMSKTPQKLALDDLKIENKTKTEVYATEFHKLIPTTQNQIKKKNLGQN